MSLLSTLLIVLVAARLLGRLFQHFNQPEMVGEILAGVLLGPALFDFVRPNPALAGLSELAVFLVILSAGLEMRYDDIARAMRGRGLVLAALAFVIPFAAGAGVGFLYDLDAMRVVFLGLCISITALPVAVKILDSLGLLDTPIARYAIATAILNDIAALLLLGAILSLPEQPTLLAVSGALASGGAKLLLLAAAVIGMNRALRQVAVGDSPLRAAAERVFALLGPESLFGAVVAFVLLFGLVAEILGFHFVIGAFFGALVVDRRIFGPARYADLTRTMSSVTAGFLAPVFFAYIGLEFSFKALRDLDFVAVVLVVSIFSKLLAGWLGGRAVGMAQREAAGLGCMLNGRGVMELVVASIAYQKGFIGTGMFSTLVLMGIVTTLLTPWLFTLALPDAAMRAYRERHSVAAATRAGG